MSFFERNKNQKKDHAKPGNTKPAKVESPVDELAKLRVELAKINGRTTALLVEREFWVEQSRGLQNQIQQWQRMYAGLLEQLGKGVVTEQSIADNLALAAEELRQPITQVEAVRALIATMDSTTQGSYTSVSKRSGCKAIADEVKAQQLRVGVND